MKSRIDAKRIARHIIFWVVCILVLVFIYGYSAINYKVALILTLMLIPVDLFYFYTVSYWVIPAFFYKKKYLKLVFAFLLCIVISTLMFRVLEIILVEPYLYKTKLAVNANFKWARTEGTFWDKLTQPGYLINAFEQSNIVIWIALFVKFIMMWGEKRQAAVQAELNFLKSQIHPHFLFNTLNNLYALTLNKSDESPEVVMGLSHILRYMLYECNTEKVLLKRDIEILQSYIGLEKIRYDKRLDINFSIRGNINNQQIPPLLMLPLIENAFKHGVSETMHDCWINIDLYVDHKRLIFKVSNSKPDIQPDDAGQHFDKIGMRNVRKRLELLHNHINQLFVYEEDNVYVTILELELN